jgi:acetolactate synthase-1/2/3 large subunit
MIIGSGVRDADRELVRGVAEIWNLPVATSFRQQHLFPSRHPLNAGHLAFNIPKKALEVLSPADLVIAVGTRLGDVTTQGYRFPAAPEPKQPLIHVHADPAVLNRTHRASIAMNASAGDFLAALQARRPNEPVLPRKEWIASVTGYPAGLLKWAPIEAEDGIVFGTIVAALRDLAPEDTIIAVDAGNFSGWVHRYFPFGTRHHLLAPVSGAMGFGMPAAVAASLRYPGRKVVGFIGDGGYLMTGNELATALQFGASPCIILSDNRSFGTIRQYQERTYPGRVIGTDLRNPDFPALVKAFGANSFHIGPGDDIAATLREALAATGPTVVTVATSLKHISAYSVLG